MAARFPHYANARIAALDAEVARLRRASERLDFLIESGKVIYDGKTNRLQIDLDIGLEQDPRNTTMDMVLEAIDAAMEAEDVTPPGALDSRGRP